MISAQDKILHVANKLGLTSLKDMQASTGAVYDVDTELSGTIFSQAARHANPSVTNINENQFEVNEALLVETVAFYVKDAGGEVRNFQQIYGSNAVIVFDLVIGNKRDERYASICCWISLYVCECWKPSKFRSRSIGNCIYPTPPSIYGRRWYFDSAASSMVRSVHHLQRRNGRHYCTDRRHGIGLLLVRHQSKPQL